MQRRLFGCDLSDSPKKLPQYRVLKISADLHMCYSVLYNTLVLIEFQKSPANSLLMARLYTFVDWAAFYTKTQFYSITTTVESNPVFVVAVFLGCLAYTWIFQKSFLSLIQTRMTAGLVSGRNIPWLVGWLLYSC